MRGSPWIDDRSVGSERAWFGNVEPAGAGVGGRLCGFDHGDADGAGLGNAGDDPSMPAPTRSRTRTAGVHVVRSRGTPSQPAAHHQAPNRPDRRVSSTSRRTSVTAYVSLAAYSSAAVAVSNGSISYTANRNASSTSINVIRRAVT